MAEASYSKVTPFDKVVENLRGELVDTQSVIGDSGEAIEISIIIPLKDREDPHLLNNLRSLLRQDLHSYYEVLVVAGGNRAQARNRGLDASKGGAVAFIDSDCEAPENWLRLLVERLEFLDDAGGVGGPNVIPPETVFNKAVNAVQGSILGSMRSHTFYIPEETRRVKALTCINSIYRREALKQVNGFDERYILNEDTDLGARIWSIGYPLYFIPDVPVLHYQSQSFGSFVKRFHSYGISRMRSMLTDRRHFDHYILSLLSLLLLQIPLFTISHPLRFFLPTFYGVMILGKGVIESIRQKEPLFTLLVPLLFVSEHLSYALGLIRGVFNGRWSEPPKSLTNILKIQILKGGETGS